MQLFRFDCGSTFGSIEGFIEKGIEKGTEEASKLESLSVLGYDWGDEARGQYIYIYIYIYVYIRTNHIESGIDSFRGRRYLVRGEACKSLKPLQA